ncbi:MAG TPA: pitrilysin family protein [Longimicrobiales bacterium]|nr:pitrilysin family protein [Longimicrobiales bacterium]
MSTTKTPAERRLDIEFEDYRLDNGLRVVLAPDASAPVVGVNIWYNVGSRNEREGRTGFAHLFEHMMFQGSEHVPEMAHFALIEQAGGSLNGSTWLDRTNYYETLPAHYLELGLWLESDRMGFLLPAMTQDKLDNQRDVVKNERRWRVDNQPYGDWDERLQAMMYPPEHPYHHSVIGSMEDLDAASLEDVQQFFRTYYAPNNAVLSLVGDIDVPAAKALVERYFGGIPRGADIPALPGRTELSPTMGGEVRDTVEQDISLARIYHAYRTPVYGSDEFYAGLVASYVLGYGRAALLFRTLIREQQLAQDVVTYAFPIVVGSSMLVLWATARPGVDVAQLDDAVSTQIAALSDVADADVERAVSLIETRHLQELQTVAERADQLSMFATLFDDPGRINTELARIRAVSTADVRDFARRYLQPENRAVLTYVPKGGAR